MINCVSCDEGSVSKDELPLGQGLRANNVPPHVRRLCDPAHRGLKRKFSRKSRDRGEAIHRYSSVLSWNF